MTANSQPLIAARAILTPAWNLPGLYSVCYIEHLTQLDLLMLLTRLLLIALLACAGVQQAWASVGVSGAGSGLGAGPERSHGTEHSEPSMDHSAHSQEHTAGEAPSNSHCQGDADCLCDNCHHSDCANSDGHITAALIHRAFGNQPVAHVQAVDYRQYLLANPYPKQPNPPPISA